MGLLRDRLALREIAEANRLVEAAHVIAIHAFEWDQWNEGLKCRYCGCYQSHGEPVHADTCPVTVVALAADKMSKSERREEVA